MGKRAVRQDYLEQQPHRRGRHARENQDSGLGYIAVRQARHGGKTSPIGETYIWERVPILRWMQSLQGMQPQGRSALPTARQDALFLGRFRL